MRTDAAMRVLQAAHAKADEIGKPVSIAIVDAGGCMVLFQRLEGASPHTSVFAEGKAVGSAFTGRESSQLATMTQNPVVMETMRTRLQGQRFVPNIGAVPLFDANGVAGAIGVSGGTGEEDEAIARVGAAAFSV